MPLDDVNTYTLPSISHNILPNPKVPVSAFAHERTPIRSDNRFVRGGRLDRILFKSQDEASGDAAPII